MLAYRPLEFFPEVDTSEKLIQICKEYFTEADIERLSVKASM